jgi:hypothetical protein
MPKSGQHNIALAPFRVGVNYWPERAGPGFLGDFEIDEVHEDFAVLSELGINFARVALDWAYFQPDPDNLRCSALAHLLELCDAAASEGVKLELLLFASPASTSARMGVAGPFPDWLRPIVETQTPGWTDLFAQPSARTAAAKFVRGIARSVGGHQAIWSYNLGDRLSCKASVVCCAVARRWFDHLHQALHDLDAKHPVTCSLNGASLLTNDSYRVDQIFSTLDHSTIDSSGFARGIDPSATEAVAAFGCALTAALSGKPCLLQESNAVWGTSAADTQAPLESLLRTLHAIGALGALIGSYVDLPDRDGHASHRTGLFDQNGELRPHAQAIRDFLRSKPFVLKSSAQALTLDISADEYYARPSVHASRLYREFYAR